MANVKLSQIAIGTSLQYVVGTNGGADFQVPPSSLLASSSIISAIRSSSAATVNVSTTTDYFLALDPTANPITVNLPNAPTTGLTYLIKDATGQSAINNITVSGGIFNIDGASTFILNFPYQSIGLTYNGTQWSLS